MLLNRLSDVDSTSNTLFPYKNLFRKNVEAEINQNFKNVLRTFLTG